MKTTDSLYDTSHQFARHPSDFFYVSADGARLDGLITLTDFLRAQGKGVPPETPLALFMTKDPAMLAAMDTVLIASSSSFREHGYKVLPVVVDKASRRIVGIIRVRKLIARILAVVPPPTGLTNRPQMSG
ncbi:MAG: CBS domain-containing protein [Lacunisphaera sp.]|nr:CBS domain-containing protein [Lacunisphaera sp.]